MAISEFAGLAMSDADPAKRGALEEELLKTRFTELCVRNNRKAPTDKRVIVCMWSDKPSTASFADRYHPAGETRSIQLLPLKIRVVAFEIRWQPIGNGSPMWATTGKIHAAPGEFFPAFGIRWDEHDVYSVIYPD